MPNHERAVAPAAAEDERLTGNYFVATYPPFSVWTAAANEQYRKALAATPVVAEQPALGLYLHVPFCIERCHYCYYLSHGNRGADARRYVEAVLAELDVLAASPALRGRKLDCIYVGGGTPSSLRTADLNRLLEGVDDRFHRTDECEVTVECAPRTLTQDKVRGLATARVTRISLGVQQMDDHVLQLSGRVHLTDDVIRAYRQLRAAGLGYINIDLMVGLPGESNESFFCSLEHVILMEPESVTLYQLEIPRNTPLYSSLQGGSGSEPASWGMKRKRLKEAFTRLESAGYHVRSAYTAVKDPEQFRFVYQEAQYGGADLIGAGVSSFSYLSGVHHQNECSLDRYMERIEAGELPLGRGHRLSDDERLVREFILQLKLGRVRREQFRHRFGVDPAERFSAELIEMVERGWLLVSNDAVQLTRAGLLRVDGMLPAFYQPEHRGLRYS